MTGAIASVGPNLPLVVLRASSAYVGSLPIFLDKKVTTAADWVENKFAPWAPLVLQAWADGDYDHLKRVVFSRADDTAQRLYYYICELQRRGLVAGPEAVIFDIAMVPRASSLAHTTQMVSKLAALLGLDDMELEAAIATRETGQPATTIKNEVCLLTGSPAPDRRLHQAIEMAGFSAIGQTLADYWHHPGPWPQGGTGDPAGAIARRLIESGTGPRSFADRATQLKARLVETEAVAAILWRIEEDEAEVWHLPEERRVLEQSGIPHLVLTRRDWFAKDGSIEEITRFLKGVAK